MQPQSQPGLQVERNRTQCLFVLLSLSNVSAQVVNERDNKRNLNVRVICKNIKTVLYAIVGAKYEYAYLVIIFSYLVK